MFFDVKLARFYFENDGEKIYANHIKQTPKALLLNEGSMFEDESDVPF